MAWMYYDKENETELESHRILKSLVTVHHKSMFK